MYIFKGERYDIIFEVELKRDVMKDIKIGETIDSLGRNLPKTTSSVDSALSSIINIFDLLFSPLQIAKIYKDAKLQEFKKSLEEKVKRIPTENIKENADLNVVGPALEALKYTILEEQLREMFANLLASSINKKEDVFPGFVDIIRQLSSDEAKLLKRISNEGTNFPLIDLHLKVPPNKGYQEIINNFTNLGDGVCEKPELTDAYLNEFERFGLITIEDGTYLTNNDLYVPLENHPKIIATKVPFDTPEQGTYEIVRKKFKVTAYGISFIKACVLPK